MDIDAKQQTRCPLAHGVERVVQVFPLSPERLIVPSCSAAYRSCLCAIKAPA